MNLLESILFYIPYMILKFFGILYSVLPGRLRLFLGSSFGWVLRKLHFRTKVVEENLIYVFPGTDEIALQKRELLFKKAYAHLGTLFLELLLLFGGLRYFVKKNVTLRGLEHWKNADQKGKGVLMLSSHVGNWEIIAAACTLHGIPGLMVTKHLKPEVLHQAVVKGRLSCGVLGTYEPHTMKMILAWIRQKKTIGCILDQYAGPPVGIRVPFFGIPVGTMTAFTYLVKKYGLEVCPITSFRDPSGHWYVDLSPSLPWVSKESVEEEIGHNTTHYVQVIEKQILQNPEQWLWTHRRFKGDLSPLRAEEWKQGRVKTN